jgi:hypothetical protein
LIESAIWPSEFRAAFVYRRYHEEVASMEDLHAWTGLAAAPVITALVAAIGGVSPALPRRTYPLLAICIGVAWNASVAAASGELSWATPLYGIVAGLAASGLYSAAVKPALR